ncbi:hypothetical protein [Hymenobacter weizhouensis]|uniref:hypothetical protein n=1 Tax=Hymenobacter sp. YIM 151500-1 TaxID=2987689 RepID=UPI0022279D42|nr:hypothetical protein [Hymenobacter sp. YIM 151500-1]UYZ62377.1 hypothetical protein OIS53_15420 [Hymenobacter sp. YIM 151500-1]
MKTSSAKRSSKNDQRQAQREARKAARPVFQPGEAVLDFIGPNGEEYYRLLPQPQIPGYTYAF